LVALQHNSLALHPIYTFGSHCADSWGDMLQARSVSRCRPVPQEVVDTKERIVEVTPADPCGGVPTAEFGAGSTGARGVTGSSGTGTGAGYGSSSTGAGYGSSGTGTGTGQYGSSGTGTGTGYGSSNTGTGTGSGGRTIT